MKTTIYTFLTLLFFLTNINAENTVSAVKLSETVYMLRSNSKMGNPTSVVSVGKDGVLLIDSAFEDMGDALNAKIKELGGDKVKFLINTHTHWDHTRGNYNFGKDVIIIGKTELRESLMSSEGFNPYDSLDNEIGYPTITIDEEMSMHFNGEEIRIIPLSAGHTVGDVAVYFTKSNVLVTGDYYFGEGYPVFYYPGGANMDRYLENVDYLINNFPDDVKITPGHGTFEPNEIKYYTKKEYKKWISEIKETINIVKGKINSGVKLETAQKEGLPEKFNHLNEKPRFVSMEKWISVIYEFYADSK